MKQLTTIPTRPASNNNEQKINVKPWIVVKSGGKKNKPIYPSVVMPCETHGYIKAKQFDFL